MMHESSLDTLLPHVLACEICKPHLPHGVRPIVQVHRSATILIAGQAPGRRVHETGIPFDDPSGERLREWMGIDDKIFYGPKIAILPMGFCFPGTGKSGDLPPRPECAPAWREQLLSSLPNIELTLVLGKYAQAYHLGAGNTSVTDIVRDWKSHWPDCLPLPHPSPRNRIWVKKNPWFEKEILPALRRRVRKLVSIE